MAKLIQVIEVAEHEGVGTAGDPHRIVMRYYSPGGDLLAERDNWEDKHRSVLAASGTVDLPVVTTTKEPR